MPYDVMEERLFFLQELYTRSAGDTRQGAPYEALVDALEVGEAVTKRVQQVLQEEGSAELTAVLPWTAHVGRAVGRRPLYSPRVRLMEDLFARLNTAPAQSAASPHQHAMSVRPPGHTP